MCEYNDKKDSIDIDNLLLQFMKLNTGKYDLFIETYSNEFFSNKYEQTTKSRYIDRIDKLFTSKIGHKNNKIYTLKPYDNFRFHYFDIRNSIYYFDVLLFNFAYFVEYYPYNFSTLIEIINKLNDVFGLLKGLNKFLKNDNSIFISKIRKKYKNKDLMKKMNNLYDELIIKNSELIVKECEETLNIFNNAISPLSNQFISFEKNMEINTKLYIKLTKLKNKVGYLYLTLTDLYFIRRFLDKSYIENTILYTGAGHMVDIIYLLIKYFNFELTHTHYLAKKITKNDIKSYSIKNFDYIGNLVNYFYKLDDYLEPTQCVDLSNFTDNFT
jgi:hypothetical protein